MVNHFSPQLDPDVRYLRAELARLDVFLRREVRRWRLAGQDPADTFRGLYISDTEVDSLLARSFSSNWGQMVPLPVEETQAFAEAENQAVGQIQTIVEEAAAQGQSLRLPHLAATFGLNRFELDTLLICLAPALDLRYERLYGYLQDDVTRKRPSVNLVLDLLAEPGPERLGRLTHFADEAPLFKYRLLERTSENGAGRLPLLSQMLTLDQTLVAWLLGGYQPHPDLGAPATLSHPSPEEVHALLALEVRSRLKPLIGQPALIVFYGPDQASQDEAAKRCAVELSRPLFRVDLAGVIEGGLAPLTAVTIALRDARLTGAIPYLTGWDACVSSSERGMPAQLLTELCAYPELVLVAGQNIWQPRGLDRERPLFWLEFPIPAYPQRLALWQHFLRKEDRQNRRLAEESELSALAAQFALTSGQIRDAIAAAKDTAAQQERALQDYDLFAAARAYSNPNLANLARKISPRYGWSDIILPGDQLVLLQEIVATVRGRPLVLDEWGVGQKLASSRGVTILFAGPPGTGKTMAAEVIAADLGLDLYKIDLSTVVSKYIGETEKNLEKIFNEAASSNAILFFDEADAIFGKRSEVKDAHDRYANIEISYLLQRMEAYDGVTILATNLRANLDEAFTRRLQFAVDFPFPEKEDRLRIWQTLFPPDVPRNPDLDFKLLAERFKLTGGNIRNIIVSAAYLAGADGGQVTMSHLLHGTRRELQKMGRLVDVEDLVTG
jgi:hypothetical protein